jgi:hypothetical protein
MMTSLFTAETTISEKTCHLRHYIRFIGEQVSNSTDHE